MGSTGAHVTAEEVPALLLAALPSLSQEWDEVADENADPGSPGGRLGYLDAAWVVGHLADRLAASDTSEFDAAFDFIEHLILHGDPYVSELGVIGYLEGMQMHTVTSRDLDPEAFRPWLRPLSAKHWEAINKFWDVGTPISNIRLD
ncbi:DUF7674 family protein [Mangrovihabitans endophyticus]|uniref:DUF7674 domain-containing protein n=1 Tax=Mangrovihabitans endophyticus TaxID=1751298 RepID=A0A8J3FSE3_9ACTN|nr:hypothetical protein [Mangrovihabitans endophyticus]GGL18919.1 hypothetical protein GCM10012284_61850 [Mangrovihabitans endophyticus]